MTALLAPFTGLVPAPEVAHHIVGPPSAVLSPEAREAGRLDPLSFRHAVGRGAAPTRKAARKWVRSCVNQGALRPVGPAVLAYRQTKADLVATGLIAEVSTAAYDSGVVKGHEATIPQTERKMADYVRTSRIYGNPIALAHRPQPEIGAALAARTAHDPDLRFVAADGSCHELWVIGGDEAEALCARFGGELYVTDGHHRLSAASFVAREEERDDARIPAGVFAADEVRLRAFARCVVEPDLDADSVIDCLRSDHLLEEVSEADTRPREPRQLGVRIGGRHYRLRVHPDRVPDDLYSSLDVNLLQDLILEPVFGITDPRRDRRLSFIPDRPEAADQAADCSAWFLPFPASVADVMAIADLGLTMPPKSTWFAPKLPAGLVIRLLDG